MRNASLQQGSLPLRQRHAIVRPWLKKVDADASDVQNYRPVSNLALIAKVVERLVSRQLVTFFKHIRLMPSVQSAYRSDAGDRRARNLDKKLASNF